MPGWLAPYASRLAAMAGHPPNAPRLNEALSYAEHLIESYVAAPIGTGERVLTFRLGISVDRIHIPKWVQSIVRVEGAPEPLPTITLVTDQAGVWGIFPKSWSGILRITVSGGYAVNEALLKAASLLVAHYLAMSDHTRSQYEQLSLGDFSGRMRLLQLPVPEAEALLAPFRERVWIR